MSEYRLPQTLGLTEAEYDFWREFTRCEGDRADLLEAANDLVSCAEMLDEFNDPNHEYYTALIWAKEAIAKAEGPPSYPWRDDAKRASAAEIVARRERHEDDKADLLEAAKDALAVLNQIKHDRDDLPRLETTARFARRGLEAAIKHAQDRE